MSIRILTIFVATMLLVAGLSGFTGYPENAEETHHYTSSSNGSVTLKNFDAEEKVPSHLRKVASTWITDWSKHSVDLKELKAGGPPRDGIPPIYKPTFVSTADASNWVAGVEPVIAVEIGGEAKAYPLQIMTWHEIVNDTLGGTPIIITFCPLCNSSMVFDRRINGEVTTFGTSGLLRMSDLVMYDHMTESLWQQITGQGIVGEMTSVLLDYLPSSVISFADFKAAHPDGQVLSKDTGHKRPYGRNPYAGYDKIGKSPFLFKGKTDGRLEAMERVVTVPIGDLFVAYPFKTLKESGVINDQQAGKQLVVFYTLGTSSALDKSSIAESRDVGATGVFCREVDSRILTFTKENGNIVDIQTKSVWNILGKAVSGTLAGKQLDQLPHGDHFWFAWAAFRPDTIVYSH